jgi:hypothetical protein
MTEDRAYPGYSPGEANLFDDSISEAMFRRVAWTPDTKFPDRISRADTVTRARIVTLTEQPRSAGQPRFLVELQAFGAQLAGRVEDQRIRLELDPDNPAYRYFRWHRRALLGAEIVLFYRRYLQDGLVTVHFRAEPNTPEVHYAVSNVARGL